MELAELIRQYTDAHLKGIYRFRRYFVGSRKNPFIEIPFPDDWHWIFLPSCSVSVKAVYSSFAIWNRAHGHLLISLHPTCFCVQPRLNAERSQYKWRFQSIYLSVQPRLNARDRCKSDFILSVDIFREARRGLSDKYLLRSQRVSPIIYWAKIIQYNPHSISTKPFLSPLIFYWAKKTLRNPSGKTMILLCFCPVLLPPDT